MASAARVVAGDKRPLGQIVFQGETGLMKASVLFGTIWEDDSLEVLWRDTPAEPSASSDGNAPDRVKLPKLKVEQRVLSVLDHTQMRALIGFKPKTFRQARTHLAVLLFLDTHVVHRSRDRGMAL
jgi:hypothetical protein